MYGSIRRECLYHVIIFNEAGLRRVLKSYLEYYERTRTHLSLNKDAPISRPIQTAAMGPVVEIPSGRAPPSLRTRHRFGRGSNRLLP